MNVAGVNLVELFVSTCKELTPQERANELRFLFAFCYPKLKEIDQPAEAPVSSAASQAKSMSTEDLISIVKK